MIDRENGVYQEVLDEDVSYLIIKKVASRNYFVCVVPGIVTVAGEGQRTSHCPNQVGL